MKIETKMNIGDTAYVVNYQNKVEEHPIDHIIVFSDGIVYKCGYGYRNTYYENCGDIFTTRKKADDEAVKRAVVAIKEGS